MNKYIARFFRRNPQLAKGGYETTRTIEARSLASAVKKAHAIADSCCAYSMSVLSVEPLNA